MAPLALVHITEDLSFNPSGSVITREECQTRSAAAAAGAFCVGFSGGVALQLHYQRFLPKSIRALLVLPTVVGAGCAASMYRHSLERYSQRWMPSVQNFSHSTE